MVFQWFYLLWTITIECFFTDQPLKSMVFWWFSQIQIHTNNKFHDDNHIMITILIWGDHQLFMMFIVLSWSSYYDNSHNIMTIVLWQFSWYHDHHTNVHHIMVILWWWSLIFLFQCGRLTSPIRASAWRSFEADCWQVFIVLSSTIVFLILTITIIMSTSTITTFLTATRDRVTLASQRVADHQLADRLRDTTSWRSELASELDRNRWEVCTCFCICICICKYISSEIQISWVGQSSTLHPDYHFPNLIHGHHHLVRTRRIMLGLS